nr:CidA/LrgA family holin-like protein [Bacillus pumilus]
MKLLKTPLIAVLQIMALFVFAKLMNVLTAFLHLRIPGTILGILVIFLLLHFKIIQLKWIELGAVWARLENCLLFFIPSAVGVIDYGTLLSQSGTSIVLVVLLSTFVVMLSTGIMTQMIAKRKERKKLC